MRAWLLLLAVLATLKPIVQVASTEDISSRFITAISARTTTTALTRSFSPGIEGASPSPSPSPSSPSAASTKAVPSTSLVSSPSSPSSTSTSTSSSSAAKAFLYENSDSDNNPSNTSDGSLIIEIKNIEESEGVGVSVGADNNNDNDNENDQDNGVSVGVANTEITAVQKPSADGSQLEKLEDSTHETENEVDSASSTPSSIEPAEHREASETAMAVTATDSTTSTASFERESHKSHHHKSGGDHQHKHHPHHHHHHHRQPPQSHKEHPLQPRHEPHRDVQPEAAPEPRQESQEEPQEKTPLAESTQEPPQEPREPREPRPEPSDSPSDDSDDDVEPSSDDAADNEPETYSNKEIISEKLKPDPSTLVEIENSLLSLFNMKRPPKIDRSKIIIPEAMKQLYAQIMGHDIDSVNIPKPGLLTKSANTVRSFTHQDSKIDDRFPHHHRFRLFFDIKSIPADEKLKAAELQLSRDAISHGALNPRLGNRTRYQVLVYDITRVGIRGKREPSYLLLDNKTIRLNSTETVSLDVQPAVDRWLESPKKNYGLLVEVRTFRALKPAPHHHVRLRRSADEPHDDWQRKQPLLFTYTDDGRHKSRSIRDVSTRSKRAGHHRRPHRRKNNEEICRRQSLYVDFSDVGWSDWIVAPPGYDAYYCHGKCPFPLAEHLNSTNHAVVQTLVNNLNPGKVPKACCVPTQLTGISMLYLNDQSTVVLKNYQDMTVVGCGCR